MPTIPIDLYSPDKVAQVSSRVSYLVNTNIDAIPNRSKTRDIMNGGRVGLARLVGRDLQDETNADLIPVANMMLKANDRLAQKIGTYPRAKADTDSENESAQKRADKKVKAIGSWDRAAKLKLQLRQMGRWLPGYGFTAWTLSMRKDINNQLYPHASLRDPFTTYPAAWTVDQQPRDIAFRHVINAEDLKRINEEAYNEIMKNDLYKNYTNALGFLPRQMGGVVLDPAGGGAVGWENQSGDGIELWEYIDESGTYWIHQGYDKLLSFIPNPLRSVPTFVICKRFSFDKLIGQYDQLIGLMAAVVRMNILSLMAVESGLNAETVMLGQMARGTYVKGHNAINEMLQGSDVKKMNDRIPFEALQQLDKLERQLRSMATYPVTDDGISPNSFVTGLGLEELKGSVELEVKEYNEVSGDGLETLDARRMEMSETLLGNKTLEMFGVVKGNGFKESYNPSRDFNGDYVTRRVYGMLSSWDDPNKIVTGIALNDKKVISREYLRDNIEGLEGNEKIKDQLKHEEVDEILMQMLLQSVSDPQSPKYVESIQALIEILPEGDEKEMFKTILLEPAQEQQEQLEQQMEQQQLQGPVPDTQTVLNRITTTGQPVSGVQSVSRG